MLVGPAAFGGGSGITNRPPLSFLPRRRRQPQTNDHNISGHNDIDNDNDNNDYQAPLSSQTASSSPEPAAAAAAAHVVLAQFDTEHEARQWYEAHPTSSRVLFAYEEEEKDNDDDDDDDAFATTTFNNTPPSLAAAPPLIPSVVAPAHQEAAVQAQAKNALTDEEDDAVTHGDQHRDSGGTTTTTTKSTLLSSSSQSQPSPLSSLVELQQPLQSRVRRRNLVACSTAHWDSQGIGVATLWLGPPPPPSPPLDIEKNNGPTSPQSIPALQQEQQQQRQQTSFFQTQQERQEIRQAILEGRLPFVPPQRTESVQWSVQLSVQTLFGRAAVTHFGSAPHRYQSLCFLDVHQFPAVQGHVALTLDDAPCRFPTHEASELPRMAELLHQYQAQATFMVIGQWCTKAHWPDLIQVLQQGHELGNHCMLDRSYEHDSPEQFGQAVDQCQEIIQALQQQAGVRVPVDADDAARTSQTAAASTSTNTTNTTTTNNNKKPPRGWFRAPHGRYTKAMEQVLHERNLVNVMCDTYASCPIIQNGSFLAQQLAHQAQDGSIILLHTPEKHVRQWCLTALEELLYELVEVRKFKVVTVSELVRLAGLDQDVDALRQVSSSSLLSLGRTTGGGGGGELAPWSRLRRRNHNSSSKNSTNAFAQLESWSAQWRGQGSRHLGPASSGAQTTTTATETAAAKEEESPTTPATTLPPAEESAQSPRPSATESSADLASSSTTTTSTSPTQTATTTDATTTRKSPLWNHPRELV
ncbi:hypothetical protein ACA910_017632 [Epithemia clementina (nom. ined.)]